MASFLDDDSYSATGFVTANCSVDGAAALKYLQSQGSGGTLLVIVYSAACLLISLPCFAYCSTECRGRRAAAARTPKGAEQVGVALLNAAGAPRDGALAGQPGDSDDGPDAATPNHCPTGCGGVLWLLRSATARPSARALTVDAWLYLRLLRDSTAFFMILAVLAWVIVVPVNLSFGDHKQYHHNATRSNSSAFEDISEQLESVSVSALRNGSDALWTHVVFCWVFSLAMVALVALSLLRAGQHSKSGRYFPDAPSVFIVRGFRTEATALQLLAWVRSTEQAGAPWRAISALVLRDKRRLLAATEAWRAAVDGLDWAERELVASQTGRVPCCLRTCPGGPCCPHPSRAACCGSRRHVTAEQRVEEAREAEHAARATAQQALQDEAADDGEAIPRGVGRAFVTFASAQQASRFASAVSSRRAMKMGDAGLSKAIGVSAWEVEPGPDPDDVMWDGAARPRDVRRARHCVVHSVVFLVMFVLTSPVALLAAAYGAADAKVCQSGWESIKSVITFLNQLSPTTGDLVLGFLPSGTILLLNVLLLLLLYSLVRYLQRHLTASRREREIEQVSLGYLTLNTLVLPSLVLTSAAALLQQLLAKNGTAWAKTLAGTFTSNNTFFVNYLVQRALLAPAFQLWRPGERFYQAWERSRLLPDKDGGHVNPEIWPFEFGQQYSIMLSTFAVGLTYSVMVPAVLPATVAFFAIKYAVDKFHLSVVLQELYGNDVVAVEHRVDERDPEVESRAAGEPIVRLCSGLHMSLSSATIGAVAPAAAGEGDSSGGAAVPTHPAMARQPSVDVVPVRMRGRRAGATGADMLGANFRGRLGKQVAGDLVVLLVFYQFAMATFFRFRGSNAQFIAVSVLLVGTVAGWVAWVVADRRYANAIDSGGAVGTLLHPWLRDKFPTLVQWFKLDRHRSTATADKQASRARNAHSLQEENDGEDSDDVFSGLECPVAHMRHSFAVVGPSMSDIAAWVYVGAFMELLSGDLRRAPKAVTSRAE